jgi:hypothetical protein
MPARHVTACSPLFGVRFTLIFPDRQQPRKESLDLVGLCSLHGVIQMRRASDRWASVSLPACFISSLLAAECAS